MNNKIIIYYFIAYIAFYFLIIYKGYSDGKKYYKKNKHNIQSDIITISQKSLENYIIFLHIFFNIIICYMINYIISL